VKPTTYFSVIEGIIPDDRLKLLFVCAHPAIDPAARTPLMLQAGLGIGAREIASAFLTSPTAISQGLVLGQVKDSGCRHSLSGS
jgi:predicted RNA polymerase sigma factor